MHRTFQLKRIGTRGTQYMHNETLNASYAHKYTVFELPDDILLQIGHIFYSLVELRTTAMRSRLFGTPLAFHSKPEVDLTLITYRRFPYLGGGNFSSKDILACRPDRRKISTAIPLFSGVKVPMRRTRMTPNTTGSGKNKMAVAKLTVVISHILDVLGTKFQRLLPHFGGRGVR